MEENKLKAIMDEEKLSLTMDGVNCVSSNIEIYLIHLDTGAKIYTVMPVLEIYKELEKEVATITDAALSIAPYREIDCCYSNRTLIPKYRVLCCHEF